MNVKLRAIARMAEHSLRLAEATAVLADANRKEDSGDPIVTHSVQRALDLEARRARAARKR